MIVQYMALMKKLRKRDNNNLSDKAKEEFNDRYDLILDSFGYKKYLHLPL